MPPTDGTVSGRPIDVWTDGSCWPNPGPGGYGVVFVLGDRIVERSGGDPGPTTNNRMELMGAIVALEAISRPAPIRIHTDSLYVQQGITEHMPKWIERAWRRANGAAVRNEDLWRRLLTAIAPHAVEWVWVRGHAGDPMNERADRLALKGRLGVT